MSRIGKQPITIPAKVKVELKGQKVSVEGPKGNLNFDLPKRISISIDKDQLVVSRQGEDAQAKALHGLSRALVNNMLRGVSEGFVKKLEIHGVGFKASVQGKVVNMVLGFSHPINYSIPDQIKVTVEENTKVTIEGPDRQVVGQVASELRSFYPPEPYKGKGVRYSDERVVRKEGKTVQ
ncbi:MAG: 50S ribosomal protein L6 [Verrucomicrobiota bacterium]|jgi:large subunit ribosomal protein L6|nr:50S ribosomal protein L6 [Verrucomicrobiota bacterium]